MSHTVMKDLCPRSARIGPISTRYARRKLLPLVVESSPLKKKSTLLKGCLMLKQDSVTDARTRTRENLCQLAIGIIHLAVTRTRTRRRAELLIAWLTLHIADLTGDFSLRRS
jgi:hypothetical protein